MSNSVACPLLAGAQLQPYWIVVANSIVLWLLNIVFGIAKRAIRKRLCGAPEEDTQGNDQAAAVGVKVEGAVEKTDIDIEGKSTVVPLEAKAEPSAVTAQPETAVVSEPGIKLVEAVKHEAAQSTVEVVPADVKPDVQGFNFGDQYNMFPFDDTFGLLQLLGIVAHFIFIATTTAGSNWDRYTQLFSGIMNSGALVFAIAALGAVGVTGKPVPMRLFELTMVLLLPGFATHSIPMLFAFIYVPIGVVVGFVLVGTAIGAANKRFQNQITSFAVAVEVRLVVTLTMIICLQTTFNYGALLYALPDATWSTVTGSEYIGVISTEWNMRSTSCYLDGISSSARHAANFASIF